jgi:hypothetical protein
MKEKETVSSAPTQRSWLETYGTVTALSAVIVIVLIVIFASTPAAVAPKTGPTPLSEKDYYAEKTRMTDQMIQEAVTKAGGNWDKIPPEGQQRIHEISQGHGKEMVSLYWERTQKDKKSNKK